MDSATELHEISEHQDGAPLTDVVEMSKKASIETRVLIRRVITVVIVAGSSLAVFIFLNQGMHLWFTHFSAGNLLHDTTTNGGDTGAHVWAPWYLKTHLLRHGEITGWSPDWFAGFPALHFYFPFASLLIVAMNAIHIPFTHLGIPYNVAFKLGTVSGLVTMPISGYIMARCFGMKFPKPEIVALAIVTFLFNTSFTIYGGNIASTLAGEFGFSISMSASLVFIGLYWQVLTKGRFKALAAVFLAITITAHILPTIFTFFVVLLMYMFHLDFSQGRYTTRVVAGQVVLAVAGLVLAASSVVPNGMILGVIVIASGGVLAYRERNDRDLLLANAWLILTGLALVALGIAKGGIPGVLLVIVAIGMTFFHIQRARVIWGVAVGFFGVCVASIWLVPFVALLRLSNDMGWEKEVKFVGDILKGPMHFAVPLAIIGFYLSFVRNNKLGVLFGFAGILSIAVFVLAPAGFPLWNARALPFWYLSATILAAIGVGELLEIAAEAWEKNYALIPAGTELSWVSFVGMILTGIVICIAVMAPLDVLPNKLFGVIPVGLNNLNAKHDDFITSWAQWNYSGYEKKDDPKNNVYSYTEYKSLYTTMGQLGKKYGCGRALWEYTGKEDRFGTPDALMLLPYWTKSCIGSMEGLYYESAASAPYHWILSDELSEKPSNPQRDLPYSGQNVALGVEHLQAMGVKYYMAISPSSEKQADDNSNLQLLKTIPIPGSPAYDSAEQPTEWKIYRVKDSDIVQPLVNQPVVAKGAIKSRPGWLEMAMHWYTNQTDGHTLTDPAGAKGVVYMTDKGPKNWAKTNVEIDNPPLPQHEFWQSADRPTDDRFGDYVSWDPVKAQKLPTAKVTKIKSDDNDISFHVDKVGVPVVVKMSYFPNWKVTGAKGPYRTTPNFMIVVPTSHDVHLHYGRSSIDWLGIVLFFVGIAGIVWMKKKGDTEYPETETEFWKVTKNYSSNLTTDIGTASDMLRMLPTALPPNDSE